jgi:hypothetical protein
MIVIEPLTFETVPYATQLAKELHELGVYGRIGPAFDWDHTLKVMIRVIKNDDYCFKLAKVDGQYTGAVVGHVEPFFFSPKNGAIEDAWFVRPGSPERTKAAVMLMRQFVAWALDEKQATQVQSGDIADIDSFAVDNIYRHLGFRRFGSIYKFQRDT